MIKKFLVSTVCAATMVTPALAADYGSPSSGYGGAWYLRGDIGVAISKDFDFVGSDETVGFGAGIGYKYNHMFRADVTFDGAVDYNYFGVDVDAYSVMVNGYVDFPLGDMIKPYIGGGIGYGWVEANGFGFSADDDGLALGGMAGVAVEITQNMAIDVGYKFRNISISGEDFQDHMIRGGLRFYF